MKCPFCSGDMKKGMMKLDGRTPPSWQENGAASGFLNRGKIIRNFRRRYPAFEADGFLCERCGKLILDVKL